METINLISPSAEYAEDIMRFKQEILLANDEGKGYAKEMLRLNLEKCRERGMTKVMVTCSPQNVASARTIIANGGVYEKDVQVDGEVIQRYWIYFGE